MKQTRVKLDLYIQANITEKDADLIMKIITKEAGKAGIPMSFQIYEVEVIENE